MSLADLALVFGAYILATASPGPATLAIMGTAMARGRRNALALAAGVITGSLTWGLIAASGLSAVLFSVGWLLTAVKIAGGLYLLWLAWKSLRSALSRTAPPQPAVATAGLWPSYRRGFLLHLTNPKAVFSWTAIIALGLRPDSTWGDIALILGGCAALGVAIFGGYALIFSARRIAAIYLGARRAIEAVFATFFAAAGFKLLAAR